MAAERDERRSGCSVGDAREPVAAPAQNTPPVPRERRSRDPVCAALGRRDRVRLREGVSQRFFGFRRLLPTDAVPREDDAQRGIAPQHTR